MINIIKVSTFSLAVIGGFWGFANFGIPQVKPAPPPVEEKLDLGAMSMEKFIALGDRIFHGKGNCTLCHNAMGRAPLLDRIATVANGRLQDPRYQGSAKSVAEYLRESMTKPSAFVVSGFGKSGSNDSVSPMPDVSGGGIGLNDAELTAVIAYLQDSSGTEVTVTIPAQPGPESAASGTVPVSTPKTAEQVIAKYSCGSCHVVAGQSGEVGPNLTHIGKTRDKAYLRQAILDPEAVIAKGFPGGVMPGNFGEEMKASELEMLVTYLAELQ
ncbi:MAG: c-type cytochrome [Gallionella sp.]